MNLSSEILARFDQLAALQVGWNEEGSLPPTAKAIALAKDILSCLPCVERNSVLIGAVEDGGIDFEWSNMGVWVTLDPDIDYCNINRSPPKPASPNDIEGESLSLEGDPNPAVTISHKILTALRKSSQERSAPMDGPARCRK